MISENNIFYRLTAENENSSTELLANLLKLKFFRKMVISYLFPDIPMAAIDSIKDSEILTQKRIEFGGQPDLQIKASEVHILLENKIRKVTTLTDYECSSYIRKLQISYAKYRKFLFLIPKDYLYESSIKQIKEEYPDIISISYWEDLIYFLEKSDVAEYSPIIQQALDYFESIVDLRIENNMNLTPMEVAYMYDTDSLFIAMSTAAKIIERIGGIDRELIKELNEAFGSSDFFSYGDFQYNEWGSGKHINSKNGVIFYGLSKLSTSELTNEYGLSVAFSENIKNLNPTCLEHLKNVKDIGYYFFPLDRKLFVDNNDENLIEAIKGIIEKVLIH